MTMAKNMHVKIKCYPFSNSFVVPFNTTFQYLFLQELIYF